jgi:hypothetical protein
MMGKRNETSPQSACGPQALGPPLWGPKGLGLHSEAPKRAGGRARRRGARDRSKAQPTDIVAAPADTAAIEPIAAGPSGLACPNCGCRHWYVIYTRPAAALRVTRGDFGEQIVRLADDGTSEERICGVRRRRECRHCGRRITTFEI